MARYTLVLSWEVLLLAGSLEQSRKAELIVRSSFNGDYIKASLDNANDYRPAFLLFAFQKLDQIVESCLAQRNPISLTVVDLGYFVCSDMFREGYGLKSSQIASCSFSKGSLKLLKKVFASRE